MSTVIFPGCVFFLSYPLIDLETGLILWSVCFITSFSCQFDLLRKSKPQLRNFCQWACLWGFCLYHKWWRRLRKLLVEPLWTGKPGLCVLDSWEKKGNKPSSSTPPWFLLKILHEFLPWCLSVMDYDLGVIKWNKPFPLQATIGHTLRPLTVV